MACTVVRGWAAVAALLSVAACAGAVEVQRLQVAFGREYSFDVNSSVELILDFVPSGDEGSWPTRLRMRAAGASLAQPLLLTARQARGANTWQLPYAASTSTSPFTSTLTSAGGAAVYELTRTLCPGVATDCEPSPTRSASATQTAFSLHVSAGCAGAGAGGAGGAGGGQQLFVLADPQRDWRLSFATPQHFDVTRTAPRTHLYEWAETQKSVRLEVTSSDDVCATVSVQDYVCPVSEWASDVAVRAGLRMSVTRSGAAQLHVGDVITWVTRSQFPRGFFVVALVQETDEECKGEVPEEDSDWLWGVAVEGEGGDSVQQAPAERRKSFTVTIEASLTRGQYVWAAAATLATFLLFYAAFALLLLGRRYPPFKRLVAPKAVLAEGTDNQHMAAGNGEAAPAAPAAPALDDAQSLPRSSHRRRDSTATFDSADDSNSETEDTAPPAPPALRVSPAPAATNGISAAADAVQLAEANGGQNPPTSPTPFGLPARLRLNALSRRSERTLAARADRYKHSLYTVVVFYALPVMQFVIAFQIILNVSGSLDLCYYNFLCAHAAGALADFNHVLSNVGYLLLGALFLLQVRRRRQRRERRPRHQEYGIPAHYGLLESLGVGLMAVALFSASYHVCPNQLNFQFDTAFMFVLSVLSMVKIYQSRHPDVNARAHTTFGVLAVLIALVVWGVVGGGALFWAVWTVLHVFTFLLLSLRIYYVGQFTLDRQGLAEATRGVRDLPKGGRPLYHSRLALLLVANAVNWGFAILGMVSQTRDFAGHLLYVLLANTLLYMVFYLSMKLLHGERLRWYAWLWLALAAAAWMPALYFFVSGSSDWSSSPAESRARNHRCKLLQFYDSHDLWHFLSAVALYFSFNAMLTWDDGLSAVRRADIAVF